MKSWPRTVLCALFFFPAVVCAQHHPVPFSGTSWVIPGIYVGYIFDSPSSFIFGFEVSTTHLYTESSYQGYELNISFWDNSFKIHFGIEAGGAYLGGSVGPTLAVRRDTLTWGLTFSAYAVVIVVPYFSYHILYDKSNFVEIGSYLKVPIQVKGERVL